MPVELTEHDPRNENLLDFRSDTVTTPSDAMREAAANAEVGDDVKREDPTVNELEARAADLMGKEAGLYVPSGTMGNQIAARVHTERGEEAIVDTEGHVYKWEVGGLAQLSELQVRPLDYGPEAVPTPEQVRETVTESALHVAGTGLLCLENSHNSRGGVAVAPEAVDAAAEVAHDHDVPVHLDGARVCNAAVAQDVDPARLVDSVDTVMFCLSKGLGAPVGSMLVGPEEFVEEARRTRKLLGGGMRQAGMIAAPGLLALENVDRLAEDHANAGRLAEGLDALTGLSVPEPDTNIVLVDTAGVDVPADEFVAACAERDVGASTFGAYTVRFCTHLDVDEADVETAIDRVGPVVSEMA
ncbi:threonine aldolase family protein [Halobium salinum]|uniref:Threonine aldolase family protein n=1 Tax=Halobium salinum TaxID=1364940 RepID=A0ABD5P7Z8_9EURY|nr:GntG family PLP-dependent aldolase [Halobium salinum]